ncbi:MAG: 50S ribosomal protein L24 [Patescibacteria group bacterium]|nr:50S ribosomal protein L24 [Patescibacteria group bacterium]
MKIKKGDNVIVIAGKDKGRQGKVLRALPARAEGGFHLDKLIVEGVNIQKQRQRPKRSGQKGQTIQAPAPLAASNVLLHCSACKRGVRTGSKITGKKKTRVCRQCGKGI